MKNQRKNKRKVCAVPNEGKKNSAFESTQTIDISAGGLGIITTSKVPLDKEIALEVVLSPDEDPVLAIGEVKWVRSIKKNGHYRVGLSFKDTKRGFKSRLNKFLKLKD